MGALSYAAAVALDDWLSDGGARGYGVQELQKWDSVMRGIPTYSASTIELLIEDLQTVLRLAGALDQGQRRALVALLALAERCRAEQAWLAVLTD